MNYFKCLFKGHEWKLHFYHYYDVSYGGNAKSTNVIKFCPRCKSIRKNLMYNVGFLKESDFSK